MKLPGWMHRKFWSSEPLKDFAIGNSHLSGQPSLDDQQHYLKSNYSVKPLGKAQRENHLRKSFASIEAARVEEHKFEEESSAAVSERFHGFLAIGTLGSDSGFTDPSTPTFAISVEQVTEKETEVTENDLKLINEELEKVLSIEGTDDGCNESSERNSYVSMGRSSHVSSITLGGKPLEGTETAGNGTTICPLQGYLVGSEIKLPETRAVVKKEHRTSLGELFQKAKMEEEYSVDKCERGEKQTEKETDKSALTLMKKMLKKRLVHSSTRTSSTLTNGNTDPASTETKLHKILHMFHRKVYPESSVAAERLEKPHKNEAKNNTNDEDIHHFNIHSNAPQITIKGSNSNGNREYWIKTDADYLVLEL
ncbi:hypothetical protein NMG60_11024682 [Bertholletia excelsa]